MNRKTLDEAPTVPIREDGEPIGQDVLRKDTARRQVLGGAGLLAAAGLFWPAKRAIADHGRRRGRFAVDVACLGFTFAPNFEGVIDQAEGLRGLSFNVEGELYRAGTIPPGEGFDPSLATPIGHWLCRGWFMNVASRPAPGASTVQEYHFDRFENTPSPRNTIVSSGLEGGAEEFVRAVVGGTGRFRTARGEVIQETTGSNTTILNAFGVNAPNFRFVFRLANDDD